ncbi:sensor domain-containing diguanylate cyclase [Tepidibacter thalassicus]|uniref:Diguanylate cyclase (GGDEF) domain-containing protein n=1 Tax=Tepidibacter thalassicus DSM 15285 TaxID=1123350 RepID=A0A1M5PLW7_9FIRM|nr:diguanylate cyclase [Tepidibacter thalassicus]SHH02696.1 diguanylate cyclase (GGDEF) domain-containing protein [Tepidibacter thalassicus DSM 15285]
MKIIRKKECGVLRFGYIELYKKIFIFFSLISITIVVFVYFLSYIFILDKFEDLEKKETYSQIKQVVNALEEEFLNLNMINRNYALCSEIYDFIKGRNPKYVKKHLRDETFIINKLNVFILVDKQGNIVYKKGFDLVNNMGISVSNSLIKQINKQSPLINLSKPTNGVTGIVSLPEGKMMISSYPIAVNGVKGSNCGILIMGRYIDSNNIKDLSQQTNLGIKLEEVKGEYIPEDVEILHNSFIKKFVVWVKNISKNHIYGYSLLYDIYGKPAFILKIDRTKYGYRQAHITLIYFLGIMLFTYSILFIANFYYMRNVVYQAHYDELTDLPNRYYFYDKANKLLMNALDNGEMVAVLFVDLDNFKIINDTLGHSIGDALLQSVTRRLQNNVTEESIISRLGGDEFIIFIPNVKSIKTVKEIAQNIVDSISRPFFINDEKLLISISVGISIYPFDGRNVDALIDNADIAMYSVKKDTKNGYKFYKK